MNHNNIITEPVTLSNFARLVGSSSEPERAVIAALQEVSDLICIGTEWEIYKSDNSPRVDFSIQTKRGNVTIEVNGLQHFIKDVFDQTDEKYLEQQSNFLKKVKWSHVKNAPLININILANGSGSKFLNEIRTAYDKLVVDHYILDAINEALDNKHDVSINLLRDSFAHYDECGNKEIDDYMIDMIGHPFKTLKLR